ncbi:MAG: DUF3784 domain-containing protein [Firmicutes bacterium]|nr:DUF3784 domain-containing protein [Bacillota bacterium]
MPTAKIVGVIIAFIVAGILALLSFRSFKEKGFLLNNAYLYATEEERKTMDKKPWYRQSAIAFALISMAFIFMGVHMITEMKVFLILEFLAIAGAVIYAIVSSIMINRREK